MSAWIVSKAHIELMVSAATKYQAVRFDTEVPDEDALGQLLWHECHRSVNYRYDDAVATPTYRHRPVSPLPEPGVIACELSCYVCQSCEHPEWEASKACAIVGDIRTAILRTLPGYEDAPWGWDAEDTAALTA